MIDLKQADTNFDKVEDSVTINIKVTIVGNTITISVSTSLGSITDTIVVGIDIKIIEYFIAIDISGNLTLIIGFTNIGYTITIRIVIQIIRRTVTVGVYR